MRPQLFIISLLLLALSATSQPKSNNWWRAALHRADGQEIVFNFESTTEFTKPVWYIRNATERIRVTDIQVKKDSLIIQMPLFESQFRLKKSKDGATLTGNWIKGGASRTTVMPFTASKGGTRFTSTLDAVWNVNGRWSARFLNKDSFDPAIGEFQQRGNYLTGTFLNPTGDYRYLEGAARASNTGARRSRRLRFRSTNTRTTQR